MTCSNKNETVVFGVCVQFSSKRAARYNKSDRKVYKEE